MKVLHVPDRGEILVAMRVQITVLAQTTLVEHS